MKILWMREERGKAEDSVHVELSAAVGWLAELGTECEDGGRDGGGRCLEGCLSEEL